MTPNTPSSVSETTVSDADLNERIAEVERRIELCVESFGSAPAALREKLSILSELQQHRLSSPPATDDRTLELQGRCEWMQSALDKGLQEAIASAVAVRDARIAELERALEAATPAVWPTDEDHEALDAGATVLEEAGERHVYRDGETYSRAECVEMARRLRRLSQRAEAAGRDAWKPIETAPRDGSLIWVACEHSMRIASWSENRWRDFHGEYPRLDVLFTPTHWMPKPNLPAPSTAPCEPPMTLREGVESIREFTRTLPTPDMTHDCTAAQPAEKSPQEPQR